MTDGHIDQDDPLLRFVGRWNPWQVMSFRVPRRQSVLAHRPILNELGGNFRSTCDGRRGTPGWRCRSLQMLADVWVDHPDFRA